MCIYNIINKVKVAGFFIPKTHMAFRLILFSKFASIVNFFKYIYIYIYITINKVKVAGFFIPKTHMAFRLILFSELTSGK